VQNEYGAPFAARFSAATIPRESKREKGKNERSRPALLPFYFPRFSFCLFHVYPESEA
jgi:hypothetical protein